MKVVPLPTLEYKKWVRNALIFTLPAVSIYLVSVLGVIQQPDHIISLKDFIPTQFAQGGIAAYFIATTQDFIRKYLSSNS